MIHGWMNPQMGNHGYRGTQLQIWKNPQIQRADYKFLTAHKVGTPNPHIVQGSTTRFIWRHHNIGNRTSGLDPTKPESESHLHLSSYGFLEKGYDLSESVFSCMK